jgi:hypothetical protein
MLDYCQYIVLQIAPAYSVVQYHHSTKWVSISNTICHFRFYDICHRITINGKVRRLLYLGPRRNNLSNERDYVGTSRDTLGVKIFIPEPLIHASWIKLPVPVGPTMAIFWPSSEVC